MAGKRKAVLWRQAFLRALRRTGNVRNSAFAAGVDPGTAYDHRAKDAGFRGKWDEAVKAFRALPASRKASADKGEELVLRRTKHGDKMVRAAAGRWCARVEESFLDALELTGCVQTAAASVRMSTSALYRRRDRYPEFAARWDERARRAGTQLPALLDTAAVASLSPQGAGAKRRGRARLPAVSVDQAIRIKVANDNAQARAGRGRGAERPPVSDEELNDVLLQRFALLDRRRLAQGWTEAGGVWLPPGWTPPPGLPPPGDGAGGENGPGAA